MARRLQRRAHADIAYRVQQQAHADAQMEYLHFYADFGNPKPKLKPKFHTKCLHTNSLANFPHKPQY